MNTGFILVELFQEVHNDQRRYDSIFIILTLESVVLITKVRYHVRGIHFAEEVWSRMIGHLVTLTSVQKSIHGLLFIWYACWSPLWQITLPFMHSSDLPYGCSVSPISLLMFSLLSHPLTLELAMRLVLADIIRYKFTVPVLSLGLKRLCVYPFALLYFCYIHEKNIPRLILVSGEGWEACGINRPAKFSLD